MNALMNAINQLLEKWELKMMAEAEFRITMYDEEAIYKTLLVFEERRTIPLALPWKHVTTAYREERRSHGMNSSRPANGML